MNYDINNANKCLFCYFMSSSAFLHYVFLMSAVNFCTEHLHACLFCQVRLDSECQTLSHRHHGPKERHRGHASAYSQQAVSTMYDPISFTISVWDTLSV